MAKKKATDIAVLDNKKRDLQRLLESTNVQNAISQYGSSLVSPERIVRVSLSAASRNPQLLECSQRSFVGALLDATEMGIEPNGRDGHLIPYWKKHTQQLEAQFQADYKGLIQVVYRTGMFTRISASHICKNDKFDYELGLHQRLSHKKSFGGPGELTGAYAIAEMKDGGANFVVLTLAEVEKREKSSRAESGPWQTHREAMFAKSAFKALNKFLPHSPEISNALTVDDRIEAGISNPAAAELPPVMFPAEIQPATASERLASAMGDNDIDVTAEEPSPEREPGEDDEPLLPEGDALRLTLDKCTTIMQCMEQKVLYENRHPSVTDDPVLSKMVKGAVDERSDQIRKSREEAKAKAAQSG